MSLDYDSEQQIQQPDLSGKMLYMCVWCEAPVDFNEGTGKLTCPMCKSTNWTDMVAIYKEDDPKLDVFLSKDELHGG